MIQMLMWIYQPCTFKSGIDDPVLDENESPFLSVKERNKRDRSVKVWSISVFVSLFACVFVCLVVCLHNAYTVIVTRAPVVRTEVLGS